MSSLGTWSPCSSILKPTLGSSSHVGGLMAQKAAAEPLSARVWMEGHGSDLHELSPRSSLL